MTLEVGTHSGSFHADDVLALAMIREFVDPDARVVRTRDLDRLAQCDVVIDVGGTFDPATRRFDHHQSTYQGPRSSAGMVLDWLEADGNVDRELATVLRDQLVDYVDAVDNGRRTPDHDVPCFTSIVGCFTECADDTRGFDDWYLEAVDVGIKLVRGVRRSVEAMRRARDVVVAAMDEAVSAGRAVLFLDAYYSWKRAYFDNGGAKHPTDFVLFPAEESWRVVAIPPEPGSFDKKRPFPAEWAGLVDDELSAVVGVDGARFCHKNRFIAVFATRDGALEALESWGLLRRPAAAT